MIRFRQLRDEPPDPGLERLVVDTEFTRLPYDGEAIAQWARSAELLSIALAPLPGAATAPFYATRRIDGLLRRRCSAFVIEQVIPALGAASARPFQAGTSEIAAALDAWLAHRPARLVVDWPGDAYLVEALTGRQYDWLLVDAEPAIEQALGADFPLHATRHNALHDAQAIARGLAAVLVARSG